MKTANKLALTAQANQNKQKQVDVFKDHKLVFTGNKEETNSFINSTEGSFVIKPTKDHFLAFLKKVRWGSHQYVRYAINECKKLAQRGYGFVKITIDKTTDLFMMAEGRNSCYSAEFIKNLLQQEGFTFGKEDKNSYKDHYDAFSDILVWDKNLPIAPDTEKIGMSWK